MSEPSKLGYGVTGWKARQENSRRRMSRNSEDRARIRAIRRQHRLGMIDEPVGISGGVSDDVVDIPKESAKETRTVTIIGHGRGWFSVEVDGDLVTESKVREDEAQAIAEQYRNG